MPNDYSHGDFPKDAPSNEPVEVTLQFNNLEVLVVNDVDFTITIKMFLGIHWREPRLVSPTSTSILKIPLDLKLLDYLWLPDLEVLNLKECSDFHILKKLAGK